MQKCLPIEVRPLIHFPSIIPRILQAEAIGKSKVFYAREDNKQTDWMIFPDAGSRTSQ